MFIPFKWFNPSNDCRLVVVGAVAVVIIVRSFFRHLPFFDCGPVEVYFIRNAVFPYFFPLRSLAFLFGILDFGSRKWICSCCRNIIFLDLLSFCPKVTLFIFFVLRISNHHLLYFYSKKTFSTAFALILISRVFSMCIFFFSLLSYRWFSLRFFLLVQIFCNCSYAFTFIKLFPFTRNKISNISRIYYQSTASNAF